MLEPDREEFNTAVCRFLLTYGREPDEGQMAVWFSTLKRFSLDQVRRAMMAYTKTGKRAPLPANLFELCEANAKAQDDAKTVGDIIRALPIRFNGSAEVFCRTMIEHHGTEKAAEIFEQSYPGHGAAYVRGLV